MPLPVCQGHAKNLSIQWLRYCTLQGDMVDQPRSAARAQSVFRSVWQDVHGFGTLNWSVVDGVTNLNVWLRTFTLAIVTDVFGM